MVKKTATPRSTQKTLTIDQELWSELESWLSSKQAKKLGYHSKAQFTTEAVRNLLERYTSGRNVEQEILDRVDSLRRDLDDYMSNNYCNHRQRKIYRNMFRSLRLCCCLCNGYFRLTRYFLMIV